MAVQLINIGNVANDGTGDDLREAFIKANANFEELDLRDDEKTSASNLGAVGEGLFVRRDIFDLEFKKIAGSTKVTVAADDTTLTISADIGLDTLTIDGNTGSLTLDNVAALSIVGGSNVNTAVTSGILTIDYTGITDLESDPTPKLSQPLDANSLALLNVGTIYTSGIIGPVTGNVVGNITSTGTSTFTTVNINGGSGDFTSLSATNAVITGNLTGDILSENGTLVFDNGSDGTDASFNGNTTGTHTGAVAGSSVSATQGFIGDVKANNLTTILNPGSDGTDAVFTGNVTGNVTGLVHGVDVRSIAVENNLDIGGIVPNLNSTLQFFLSTIDINYGTITSAASINSDFGTLA